MSASIIIAIVITIATIGFCLLEVFAAGMSDSGYASRDAMERVPWHLGCGLALAALVAASHWLHLVW